MSRPPQPSPDRRWLFATALCAWSALYVLPHLYWALGGESGFTALKPSATAHEEWRVINAVASVVLVLPVGVGLALLRAPSNRAVRAVSLIACLGGASISVSHGLYGVAYRLLNIVGVVEIDGRSFSASEHPWVLWDLLAFEPWFLIEGLLFVAAGWTSLSAPGPRRRWVVACLAGTSLAMVSGVLGLRIG